MEDTASDQIGNVDRSAEETRLPTVVVVGETAFTQPVLWLRAQVSDYLQGSFFLKGHLRQSFGIGADRHFVNLSCHCTVTLVAS
jgi:hypothetical protein